MFATVRKLWKNTAIRLSIIFSLVFGLLAFVLVAYLVGGAVHVLREQFETSIDQEVSEFSRIYRSGGINRLVRAMEVRARGPGANLYIITDRSGRILAGNVRDLERGILDRLGWTRGPFEYSRFTTDDDDDEEHEAIARIIELPNGMRALIGRDIGEREAIKKIVLRSLRLALGLMVLFGILTWIFVGRRAMKRIDLLSKSTDRILAGDREERLPISGADDEFDRLSGRLNEMLTRINQLDQGLKQVSDNIAHDLKTPLTRLRNKAESGLVAKGDAQQEIFESLVGECDNLIKTFNALLMISRVESGSSAAEMSSLDLSGIAADIVELYEPVAEEEGYRLDSNIQSGVQSVGNRELLSQAMANLIDNAVKYGTTEDGGDLAVEVALKETPDAVILSVADNGNGIAEEDRAYVLERFTRLEASRNKPGNGLGLSLVGAVAKLHNGEVRLEDNEPGLRVELIFPIKDKTTGKRNKRSDLKPSGLTKPIAATQMQ